MTFADDVLRMLTRRRWLGCVAVIVSQSSSSAVLDKCTVRLRAGDVLRMLTPGGGGWGEAQSAAIAESEGPSLG